MIIIATAFVVVMVIFGKKFFVVFCKNNELRSSSTRSSTQSNELPRRLGRPPPAATVALPAEPNEQTPALAATSSEIEAGTVPSAPPSYEEVIKDNPGILSRGVPLAPPSYSESQSMTTTQV